MAPALQEGHLGKEDSGLINEKAIVIAFEKDQVAGLGWQVEIKENERGIWPDSN